MALRINTNVAALNAHKNMIKNDNSLAGSLEKLSSGLRINKAADDASGMAIADSLKSQALGLGQAMRNANDGISMVQTADGALEESINIVNTIKTKAIQAAQDGQTTDSRKAIQADINKLMEELDMIAKTTSFNGQKLLSGQFTDKKFQIGAFSGETVGISIGSTEAGKVGHLTTGLLKTDSTVGGEVRLSI
jgi:flagellin